MRYWSFPDRRIPIGSNYPVFTFTYERSMPVVSFGAEWERLQFAVQRRSIRLADWGYSDVALRTGFFTNNENVPWPDRFHFNGNEVVWVSGDKYLNGFLTMPYFEFSGDQAFATLHFEHHFNGFLLDKIPLINKLGWKTVLGYSRMQQPAGINWNEVVFGIEHIGISLYRGIRINLVGNWGTGQDLSWGFSFSMVNALGIQL